MKELKRLLNNYTLIDLCRLFRDKLLTIIFFGNHVRIVRHPFYIVGKKYIEFGKDFQSGPGLRIEMIDSEFARILVNKNKKPELNIGANVSFNFNNHIGVINRVSIGNNTLLGSNISILDHNHGNYRDNLQSHPSENPRDRILKGEEVVIGSNVWIGDNVTILPGTEIGNGCIVGANSVVKGSFGENLVLIGNPAKTVKKFIDETNEWEKIN